MAKDPAFLFYPGDWLGGTMTMNRHQKGCYIDLLVAQFNNGPLSLETIKAILGQDQAVWTVLSKKFKQDSEGNFSNEKLATEIEKRKVFSQSRRDNISKRYQKPTSVDTSVVHMNLHMENENENEDRVITGKGGTGGKTTWHTNPTDQDAELEPLEASLTIEFIHRIKRLLLTSEQVNDYWVAFKIQNFTGAKHYHSRADCVQHFRNWLKMQDFGTTKKPSANPNGNLSTSEARINALGNLR